jgi:hypothetical protein
MGAHLNDANISLADLREANLREVDLSQADLREVDLAQADLRDAKLNKVNLTKANVTKANFSRVDLSNADLSGAILDEVVLRGANLVGANLISSSLITANLSAANLRGTFIGRTLFRTIDLSKTDGLEEVRHSEPSTLCIDTMQLSGGKVSVEFLRGCGLRDWEIESAKLYNPDLSNEELNMILYKIYDLRASQALQISPLFISYSYVDGNFVDKLEENLNQKGIRFWRDAHGMKSGRVEKQIDWLMSLNPIVLLILSERSIKSDWVEHQVRRARELEKELARDVLFPIALDDSWKTSPWPKRTMEQVMEYNILDFSAWQDDSKFDGMFRKLIDGLELFYKG